MTSDDWEYGIESSDPINGDRHTTLLSSLAEAREYMVELALYRPVLLGRRPKRPELPWEPISASD